jgi:hypothetical protein
MEWVRATQYSSTAGEHFIHDYQSRLQSAKISIADFRESAPDRRRRSPQRFPCALQPHSCLLSRSNPMRRLGSSGAG